MTTLNSTLAPIQIKPGVQPVEDKTRLSTPHYTYSSKIRFINGFPAKIGGWKSYAFAFGQTIVGVCRSIFSANISARIYTILGTSSRLYSLLGNTLTNITPLVATPIAIPASLATTYATLTTNPLATVTGQPNLVVTDPAYGAYMVGDAVTLAGATAFNGFTTGQLNAQHAITAIGTGNYTLRISSNATATGSGGGAAVIAKSGLVQAQAAANGMANGDRVLIAGATAFGGLTAPNLNAEFLVRAVSTGAFYFMTAGTATSTVLAGGGAGTTYQPQIAAGRINAALGQGYGQGKYGVGLYGVSKLSSSGINYPRVWFLDLYGNTIVGTAGNQTGVYQWFGSDATAPALITNAPAAVNYAFVSDSTLVVLGADGIPNRITGCDQGNITNWTSSSLNTVYRNDVQGAGPWITHAPFQDRNLLFTANQVWSFRFIGKPDVWEIKPIDPAIGIIGPMARVSVGDKVYWFNDGNFYEWDGTSVTMIPSNSDNQSTLNNWFFDDLNFAQKYKCFAWFNPKYNEIWFHAPSDESNEPDKIARFHIYDLTWAMDTMDRSAAEYPHVLLDTPRLIDQTILYKHELGNDADNVALPFQLTSNLTTQGKNNTGIDGFIPDSNMTGNIQFTLDGYLFPQSTKEVFSIGYNVTSTTERVPTALSSRYWTYTWSGSDLGQSFQLGTWQPYLQGGSPN